jgi:hypothetical protein
LLNKAKEYNLPDNLHFGDWYKLNQVQIEKILKWLWNDKKCRHTEKIIKFLIKAKKQLKELVSN